MGKGRSEHNTTQDGRQNFTDAKKGAETQGENTVKNALGAKNDSNPPSNKPPSNSAPTYDGDNRDTNSTDNDIGP
jgi:hypothetical protein